MDSHLRHTYAGSGAHSTGIGSSSGYNRVIDNRYGVGSSGYGPNSRVNQSMNYSCHYCGKEFNYQYDLNNHYVYCSKRTGKYGAEARAEERGQLSTSTKYTSEIDTYGNTYGGHDVKDPLLFDPKEPQFGLINSYKHYQLNCFMNAVL